MGGGVVRGLGSFNRVEVGRTLGNMGSRIMGPYRGRG